LRVVWNHAGHEIDVGLAVGLPHEIGPGLGLCCLPRPGLLPRGGDWNRRDEETGRDQSPEWESQICPQSIPEC
jgi:hypothetical protein